MSILHYPLKLVLYFIIFFGIIDGLPEFKDHIEIIAAVVAFITFASIAAPPKPYFFSPILFSILAVLASPSLYTFALANIIEPTITATNCEGHHVMEMGWMSNMLIAYGITVFLLLIYYISGRNIPSSILDKLLSGIGILLLIAYFLVPSFTDNLNDKIDEMTKPKVTLPADCI